MNAFLLKELMRTLFTQWRLLLWGAGALVLSALALGVWAIVLIAEGDWGENRLIVLFDSGVSSEQIRQVYRQVRQWEAISEVFYISKDDPRYAQDNMEPERAPAGYLRVTVRQGADMREAEAALRDLAGVTSVQSYQKGALRALVTSDSTARALATVIEIGSVLLALFVLVLMVHMLAWAWRGELEILYLSGLSPWVIRGTFFSVAVIWGTIAGILAILIMLCASNTREAHYWLPELMQSGSMGHVGVWALGLAVLLGAGAGLVGAWTVRIKR